MWAAILEIIKSFLGIFKSKEDRAAAKEKIINEAPFREAKVKQENVSRKDENEKLVATVGSGDKAKSDAALEEIRKRLGK